MENDEQMVKCPHCGMEIYELLSVESGTDYTLIDKDGEYYEPKGGRFHADGKIDIYVCPECEKEICKTEEEALRFLNTGKLSP